MLLVKRSQENPILLPDRSHNWEALAAFNGCAVEHGRDTWLFYRAESPTQQFGDANLSLSTIGIAESRDGVHFDRRRQFLKPEHEWEKYGCEDPRATKIGSHYFVFYTALSKFPFSADGIRVAVAITKDGKKIIAKHPVTTFNAKAMSLFPKTVNGEYLALLTAHTDQPPAVIGLARFKKIEDLWSPDYWDKWHSTLPDHALHLQRSPEDHVELGAPPIWTKHGWIIIYSYIKNYFNGGPRVFSIEAALLDLSDPRKIIGRTTRPLLTPEDEYEQYGRVPNIVFPSGALVKKETLYIYYGAADTTCCVATLKLPELIAEMKTHHGSSLLRFKNNPLIKPKSDEPWRAKAVFNPGAVVLDGKIRLVYRAMSHDNTSTMGYAASKDGVHFYEQSENPIYVPREPFEHKLEAGGNSGCEDPRLTVLGDKVFMCYTAYDGKNPPRVALTSITCKDFAKEKWNWVKPILISPPNVDDKDAAMFPKKINGQYAFLHRLGNSIWIDFVDNLNFAKNHWLGGQVLMSPDRDTPSTEKIGIAGPPIEVDEGWLLLYHGLTNHDGHHYHLGAALLDKNDPTRVIAVTKERILEPEMPYEQNGQVPNVVFSNGAVIHEGELFVYYGGADSVIAGARISLSSLLKKLR